jgi:hypothetical protein
MATLRNSELTFHTLAVDRADNQVARCLPRATTTTTTTTTTITTI